MADSREVIRAKNRARRIELQRSNETAIRIGRDKVLSCLEKGFAILEEDEFIELLRMHGITSIPKKREISYSGVRFSEPNSTDSFLEPVLHFVVLWRFISPLLNRPAVAHYLDAKTPGFTIEIRDAFIFLATEGPFPYQNVGKLPRKFAL